MFGKSLEKTCYEILDKADIKINGSRLWDIHVHDKSFYSRALSEGSLGLGETYIDGLWDCEKLDEAFYRIKKEDLASRVKGKVLIPYLKAKFLNLQNRKRALEVGRRHYDMGNKLYLNMLDSRMIYTCGYWKDATNLDEAQENKLDLVCRKINLKPGMKILDIGCGWGGFLKYAHERYGVSGVGITISEEQKKYAENSLVGLPIEIRKQDYRDLNEKFDGIVSLGMFEHVGHKNYKHYMKIVSDSLKDEALFLLHTIGSNAYHIKSDPWIDKYIFPGGFLPSPSQITNAFENLFILEDWHNFGIDYDKTLMAWNNNFNLKYEELKENNNYDERFKRMWNYYLLSCAGSFRSRKTQLWQIVLSKNGLNEGYQSIR